MAEKLEYVVSLRGGPEAAANVRRLEGAVKDTGGSMKQLGRESIKARPGLDHAAGGIRSVGKALLAAGAGFVAWEAGKKAFEQTHELVVSTKQLTSAFGLSATEASHWAAVTTAVGGNAGQSAMAFQKLSSAAQKQTEQSRKLVAQHKAQNTALITGKNPLEKLGLSTAYLEKHQKNLGPVMEEVVSKIHSLGDTTARGSILTTLFGRGWKTLSPILLEGRGHLDHLLGLAKKFGVELKGGATDQLEQFREKEIESNLATQALRLRFTELAAGPTAQLLKGFSDLALALTKHEWQSFDKQLVKIGETFSHVAEVAIPHMAETFAHLAPIVFTAFVHGFEHASIGGQLLVAAVVAQKMGLTPLIWKGMGKRLGTSVATGVAAESAGATAAGSTLGAFFGKAFIAVAIGYFAGTWLSKLFPNGILGHKERSPKEVQSGIAGGQPGSHAFRVEGGELKPNRGVNKAEAGSRAGAHRWANPFGPQVGETIPGFGKVVGIGHGPRHVRGPSEALVVPHGDGGAHSGDIVIKVGEREFARISKRIAMRDQAAGAG